MSTDFDSELMNLSDVDNSTIYTAKTPPETITGDPIEVCERMNDKPIISSVPWPGSTYIIRSNSAGTIGQVITLLEGRVILAHPGSRGSMHWDCTEKDRWLDFRNPVSRKLLGHDEPGRLRCVVDHHRNWEHFCVRMKPEGGFVLFLRNGGRADSLWQVGLKVEKGKKEHEGELAKIQKGDGIVWNSSSDMWIGDIFSANRECAIDPVPFGIDSLVNATGKSNAKAAWRHQPKQRHRNDVRYLRLFY